MSSTLWFCMQCLQQKKSNAYNVRFFSPNPFHCKEICFFKKFFVKNGVIEKEALAQAVDFAKILRTPFFLEHFRWLLPQHKDSILASDIKRAQINNINCFTMHKVRWSRFEYVTYNNIFGWNSSSFFFKLNSTPNPTICLRLSWGLFDNNN